MGKEHNADLLKFMLPYPDHVKAAALWLRDFVWDLYPDANELVYDNYNAVVFGWSVSDRAGDAFCSIALYNDYLNFGFMRGTEFPDRKKLLSGAGSQYRYIRVKFREDFPEDDMKQMLVYAHENAVLRLKPSKKIINGQTIVKAISKAKRRPG